VRTSARRRRELPAQDVDVIRRTHRILAPICDIYFRSEVRHLDRVPDGPTIIIGNHDGGTLPVDAMALGVAWHRHFQFRRPLRVLMHFIPFRLVPQLTRWLHGCGIVSADPHNLEALLDDGDSVLIYPGAAREAFRPYVRRREIDLGGRTGFVVRALRRGIPITPVVSAGAHETFFVLARGGKLARALGIYRAFRADAWPLIVGLPWGIWLGPMIMHLPLPSKITVEVLHPIDLREELSHHFDRAITAADADDRAVVRAGFELVRSTMHAAIGRLYDERRFPVIG
jgi:1-acyl-sn-glycerol-3-phosphate acyltransferase